MFLSFSLGDINLSFFLGDTTIRGCIILGSHTIDVFHFVSVTAICLTLCLLGVIARFLCSFFWSDRQLITYDWGARVTYHSQIIEVTH